MLLKFAKNLLENARKEFQLFDIIAHEIYSTYLETGRSIRIADLGCGSGEYWNKRPMKVILEKYVSELWLVDASKEFDSKVFEAVSKISRVSGALPEALMNVNENFFDLTIALDLIEHLPKSEGFKLLYEVDRVTMLKSLFFTPNGFLWQPPSENNVFNAHLSGWTPSEFRSFGWSKVLGLTGLKKNYGPYGARKKRFNYLTYAFHLISLPIIRKNPRMAFSFLAIKQQKNPRIEIQL
jgi:SAM-dependent methyltransferase